MGERNGSVWKTLAMMLLSIVITGLATWLALARDVADRREVATMIKTGACQEPEVRQIVIESSPYQHDKAVIKKSLDDLEAQVDSIDNRVDSLRTEQTKLIERIDLVLNERDRRSP